jgi:hypothetical protein
LPTFPDALVIDFLFSCLSDFGKISSKDRTIIDVVFFFLLDKSKTRELINGGVLEKFRRVGGGAINVDLVFSNVEFPKRSNDFHLIINFCLEFN